METFERVLHALEGEEITRQKIPTTTGGAIEFERRTIGPGRWIRHAKCGRLDAINFLAIILVAVLGPDRWIPHAKRGLIGQFIMALAGDREPAARRIVGHWSEELRAATHSGEITARDPVTWLPLKALTDSWEWMISGDDAEKFVTSRGMEWTVASIIEYLDADHYYGTPRPAEAPAQTDTSPSSVPEKAVPEVTPQDGTEQGDTATTTADDAQKIDEWIVRAREIANVIWLRMLNICQKPSKEGIADEIASRLHKERLVTKTGKRISAAYVLRHALRNGWNPPQPD